jgi:hypothetical protein
MICDVRGSTSAIKAGRYKTVNMLGASSIAAVVNVIGSASIPFSFGGDGATALLPPEVIDDVKKGLRTLRAHALAEHGLEFRMGLVPLAKISDTGATISVAKFALGGGPCIAFFQGRGLALAEEWVKSGKFEVEEGPTRPIHEVLKGLSCRWSAMPSQQGCILSIIVKAKDDRGPGEELTRVLKEIDRIIHLNAPETNPVKPDKLAPANLRLASGLEAGHLRIRPKVLARVVVMAQILLLQLFKILDLSVGGTKVRAYIQGQRAHSDSHKFDDMLRLVVDCDERKRDRLLELLAKNHREGKIFYGVHEAQSALLTCFVQSLNKGEHIHFVDGNDGGYALAAKKLKQQMTNQS